MFHQSGFSHGVPDILTETPTISLLGHNSLDFPRSAKLERVLSIQMCLYDGNKKFGKMIDASLQRLKARDEKSRTCSLDLLRPLVKLAYNHSYCLLSLFGYRCYIACPGVLSIRISEVTTESIVAIAIDPGSLMQSSSTDLVTLLIVTSLGVAVKGTIVEMVATPGQQTNEAEVVRTNCTTYVISGFR